MTWSAKEKRWHKRYKGQSFAVSPKQLGCLPTRSASRDAADRWWQSRKREIDEAAKLEYFASCDGQAVNAFLEYVDTARRRAELLGDGLSCSIFDAALREVGKLRNSLRALPAGFVTVEASEDGPTLVPTINEQSPKSVVDAAKAKLLESTRQDAALLAQRYPFSRWKPAASLRRVETIGQLVESYKTSRRADVDRGNLSADQFGLIVRCLKHFADFVGNDLPASAIDEQAIEGYRSHTLTGRSRPTSRNGAKREKVGKLWSSSFVRKFYVIAKQFINWLYAMRHLHEKPRNLDSLAVRVTVPKIETFTPDEVKLLLDNATGMIRLALLLSFNTGMLQKDISDLRSDEVDWQAGRIIRKRSKTRAHDSAPEVNYLLWPETFALLKELRCKAKNADRVLLNVNGNPLISEKLSETGKHSKSDTIKCAWFRLSRAANIRQGLSLKHARKTAASLLDAEYGESVAQRFLGHASRTIVHHSFCKSPLLALLAAA